jgi:cytidylate kinase
MSNKNTIAISGKSGCGNSTVSKLVAEKLGFAVINYTFRTMAEELGMDFDTLHKMASEDPKYDYQLDEKQVALASEGNCVLGSRLAIWLLKEKADITVYLEASEEVRARRIQKREEKDLDALREHTRRRDARDRDRYIRLYDIDFNDYQFADLIINTEDKDQYEIADMIEKEFRNRN